MGWWLAGALGWIAVGAVGCAPGARPVDADRDGYRDLFVGADDAFAGSATGRVGPGRSGGAWGRERRVR